MNAFFGWGITIYIKQYSHIIWRQNLSYICVVDITCEIQYYNRSFQKFSVGLFLIINGSVGHKRVDRGDSRAPLTLFLWCI